MNRIALITDLHIKRNGLVNTINTELNFYKLVNELKTWKLNHIICAGDLSAKEPDINDCYLVKESLDSLNVPYSVINGNHDKSIDIASVFGQISNYHSDEDEVYFYKKIGERDYLFLDTNMGQISDTQCKWLSNQLNLCQNPPFIVMHYPPIDSGVIYIDAKHQFKDMEKILPILTAYQDTIHIFCGHCHSERLIHFQNLQIHITPSCLVQVDERSNNFQKYHDFVGYRIIEEDNGAIRTFVKYLF